MSALTDAITAADPWAVARAIRHDPDWQVFNLLWDSPEEIIPACDRMGWQTLDDLLHWVQDANAAIRKTMDFVDLVDPPVPFGLDGPRVSMPIIHQAIVDQAQTRADFFIDQSDREYTLLTKDQWEMLGQLCPIRRRKWVNETMDCDDYVNAFRGWLASKGLGNAAQGFCGISMYDKVGNLAGGHAVALVMDDTRKLWFLEPQNGRLYDVTYSRLGGNLFASSVRIARAYF